MPATTIHVVQVFDATEDGGLIPGVPQSYDTAERARRVAQQLSKLHAGVIAFSRTGDMEIGEYGPSTVLFQAGTVPEEME